MILAPTRIGLEALEGAAVEMIAMGYSFTLLLARRRVYHTGSNACGQRGSGTSDSDPYPDFAAVPLPQAAEVVEIACGYCFALALLADGAALSWGGSGAHLGRGGSSFTPLPVDGLRDVKHLYAGGRFAFALLTSGEVFAWGYNDYGQLCLDCVGHKSTPQRVAALCGKAQTLALSNEAGIALCSDGSALAWGKLNGRMADGSATWAAEGGRLPIRIDCGGIVSAVAAGRSHFSVICGDQLVSWGDASCKQLGRDGPAERRAPCPFPGGGKVSIVICTRYCTLAKAGEQWAICGSGGYGPPFGSSADVPDLTPVPDPWVPFPKQVGCFGHCIFYTCGELPEETTNGAAADAAPEQSSAVAVEGLKADLAAAEAALAAEQARNQELQRALAAAKAIAETAAPSAGPTQPWPELVTFDRSVFRKVYDDCTADQYQRVRQVDRAVEDVFAIISQMPDCSSREDFEKMHDAMMELTAVRDGVEFVANCQLGTADGSTLSTHEQAEIVGALTHNPVTRACVYWTAGKLFNKERVSRCAKIEGREQEFCGMLNWMIRTDREDILTAAMPFFRALCSYTNAERTGDKADVRKQWDMVKDITEMGIDSQGNPIPYKTLYRGGSFKSDCLPFFVPGTGYRAQGFLATSPLREKAEWFIKRTCGSDGHCKVRGCEPVLWKFLVDDKLHCMHATYIERSLLYQKKGAQPGAATEVEFLFAAYSWFEVCSVYRGNRTQLDPLVITVRCAVDNTLYPPDAPTSPWN